MSDDLVDSLDEVAQFGRIYWLVGTEDRINVARMEFNQTVGDYNSAIRRLPGTLISASSHWLFMSFRQWSLQPLPLCVIRKFCPDIKFKPIEGDALTTDVR